MAQVVEAADTPGDMMAGRVRFIAHDLLATQTTPADVFFFRWILHNWPDRYCIRILRAQVPALKRGNRLVVQESLMPGPGTVTWLKERDYRYES